MSANADEAAKAVAAAEARKPWYRRMTLGVAGFALSITLAAINAYYAMRGSVMVVQPPQQVILYRDGEGDRSILVAAVRLATINTADSAHGDVLMTAELSFGNSGPRFAKSAIVRPVFTDDPAAASKCELGARCIVHKGLMVIEQPDEIIAIPGGTVRDLTIAYPVVGWNCTGAKAVCDAYGTLGNAARRLGGGSQALVLRLKFFDDGERTITCRTTPFNAAYLAKNGWTALGCEDAKVAGGATL